MRKPTSEQIADAIIASTKDAQRSWISIKNAAACLRLNPKTVAAYVRDPAIHDLVVQKDPRVGQLLRDYLARSAKDGDRQRKSRENRQNAVLSLDALRMARSNGWELPEDFNGFPGLPEPTAALPGTEEKIRVLTERATARLELHHPADRKASLVGEPGEMAAFGAPTTEEVVDGGKRKKRTA